MVRTVWPGAFGSLVAGDPDAVMARRDLVEASRAKGPSASSGGVIIERIAKGDKAARPPRGVQVLAKACERGLRLVGGQKCAAAPGHALGLAQMQVGDQ